MITSASGWRKVFVQSGNQEDTAPEIGQENEAITALAAESFAEYLFAHTQGIPSVIVGIDTRPTGPAIADILLRVFLTKKITVSYAGITAAPEIMAAGKKYSGFVYVSASHNPVGHNGIKFGLNNGGVLEGAENKKITDEFNKKCAGEQALANATALINSCSTVDLDWLYAESVAIKKETLREYRDFTRQVITDTADNTDQQVFFSQLHSALQTRPVGIVCDMNGSARTLSIDASLFSETGITFYPLNNVPGKIVHEIIPEPENLVWCAREIEKLQQAGHTDACIGYMPDCDGDRGNIVYWDYQTKKAVILNAQDVFALSVLAEFSFQLYRYAYTEKQGFNERCEQILLETKKIRLRFPDTAKYGVVVNDPTSMRIDEIAAVFGVQVFRAEVGEANVVNLAREKRAQGYTVRILGEGSNGGNITHPAAVRDPLNTLFAFIKLLTITDTHKDGKIIKKGLFHLWCSASGQESQYRDNYTITDIIATLPKYTTTGVSEKRAVLTIKTPLHKDLKGRFQKIFEREWHEKYPVLYEKFGFISYEARCYNGTHETRTVSDFSESGNGGLKIIFYTENEQQQAFIWMRGSGTEPVFRVMCDRKGNRPDDEKWLLEWETKMLLEADSQ
jgi:phosphoglucomutase